MPEHYSPETLGAYQLSRALSDIADFAVLTSGGQSHPTFRPPIRLLADFYHDQSTHEHQIFEEWISSIESDAGNNQDNMVRATTEFLDDPLQLNRTLAMRRMYGRWDGVVDLESQSSDVVRALQSVGYNNARLFKPHSLEAKVSLSLVPGTTDVLDYIALRRNRLWIGGQNKDLPLEHPRRVLEVDKTSWFSLRIPSLAEVEASAAQKEVWLIIICTALLQDINKDLDWESLRKAVVKHSIGIADLPDFLHPNTDEKSLDILGRAIARSNQYGIPDHLIMSRLFDTEYVTRIWSPASRAYLESFIASSTYGPHYPSRAMARGKSGLLVPAETIYYLSGRPVVVDKSVPVICDNNGLMWPEMASNTTA